jgi:hypothetical protein
LDGAPVGKATTTNSTTTNSTAAAEADGVGVVDAPECATHDHCPDLSIEFPRDHGLQRELALEFKKKSNADFDCCVGAVDGILIWIHCPSAKDSEESAVGPRQEA